MSRPAHYQPRHVAPTRADAVVVSPLHLARELVRADAGILDAGRQVLWDRAEAWTAYRERLQDWRFALVRGGRTADLYLCPECGAVSHLEGRVRCFACGQWYETHE